MVLQDSLLDGQWHVLHFIGYGDFDPAQDEGVLALVREDGRADLVAAHRLVDLLRQARPMPRQNLIPPLGDSRHESTLLSRQPRRDQECTGLCTSLWMNCANTQDGGAMPAGMPADPLPVPPANYQRRCGATRWAAGEDPEGIATVPAPDGYPHVTSG